MYVGTTFTKTQGQLFMENAYVAAENVVTGLTYLQLLWRREKILWDMCQDDSLVLPICSYKVVGL